MKNSNRVIDFRPHDPGERFSPEIRQTDLVQAFRQTAFDFLLSIRSVTIVTAGYRDLPSCDPKVTFATSASLMYDPAFRVT